LPQDRELKEQSQGVKKEHDIRFPKGEKIYTLKGMYVKIGWKPLQIQNIFNIYNNICNNNNSKHKKVYKLLNCKRKKSPYNLLLKSLD